MKKEDLELGILILLIVEILDLKLEVLKVAMDQTIEWLFFNYFIFIYYSNFLI